MRRAMSAAREQIGDDHVIGAEVGVHGGIHAREIITQWKGLKTLHLVDNYICGTRFYDSAVVSLKGFEDRFVWHKEDSNTCAKRFEDGFFDFVYIDASHAYVSVRDDCMAWWPKIRSGGVMCGHDYRLDWENMAEATPAWKNAHGVVKAVNEFSETNKLKLNTWVDGSGSDWWIIK